VTTDRYEAGRSEAGIGPLLYDQKSPPGRVGLPMLAQAAENAGGFFEIESEPGKGTVVTVAFQLTHIDRSRWGSGGTL